MRPTFRRSLRWFTVALLVAGWGTGASLLAAEFREEEKGKGPLVVKSDEVIEDDLYLFGENIVVEGTIKGDLFAFGQNVTIKGKIEGDLIAAGQTILVEGTVGDDARLAGEVIKLAKTARIGHGVSAAAYSLECEPESEIAEDLLYGGTQALLAGKIDRDLTASLEKCQFSADVGRNVSLDLHEPLAFNPRDFFQMPQPALAIPAVTAGLTVAKDAKVKGKLSYQSPREASIEDPAVIAGGVEHKPTTHGAPQQPQQQAPPTIQSRAIEHVKNMAGIGLFGLIAVVFLPRWSREMADNLRRRPLASIVGGFLGLIGFGVLLAAVVGATIVGTIIFGTANLEGLAAATALAGVFSSLALWCGFLLVFIFLAPAIASAAIGRLVLRSESIPTVFPFLLGLIALVALTWIPIPLAGLSILGLAIFLGFGAYCVWLVAGAPPPVVEQARLERAKLASR